MERRLPHDRHTGRATLPTQNSSLRVRDSLERQLAVCSQDGRIFSSGSQGEKGAGTLVMVHESLSQSKDLRFNETVPGRLVHVRIPGRKVFSGRAHVPTARLAMFRNNRSEQRDKTRIPAATREGNLSYSPEEHPARPTCLFNQASFMWFPVL